MFKFLRPTSTPDLTPAFATGWRKLPDELKLEALGHLLQVNNIRPGAGIDYPLYTKHFHNLLLPLFACPELCELAKEAYYKHNTFVVYNRYLREIHPLLTPVPEDGIRYIRHLVIWTRSMDQLGVFCRRVVNGEKPSLRQVMVETRYASRSRIQRLNSAGIRKCRKVTTGRIRRR
jgi:hypothetical protein